MPRAFVIQGFGRKQDYQQQKTFDLDASYAVIKEAVIAAGYECSRADELGGTGSIDQVMYDELLDADLVVADITTLNFNAAFELGVRCALRPRSTIIVGEQGLNFPFDVNHVYIHKYEHLGPDIGHKEAKRFGAELTRLAAKVLVEQTSDSPVYQFLRRLPPDGYISHAVPVRSPGAQETLRSLTDRAKQARDNSKFTEAVDLWEKARTLSPKDEFIVQQLALATYKSRQPTALVALKRAKSVLEFLQPRRSFDPETLGLWAAVHKRLFEIDGVSSDLEEALFALERGYFLKKDYYNGINLAFVLDVKASLASNPEADELRTMAKHVRRQVILECTTLLGSVADGHADKYWLLATIAEAHAGVGDDAAADEWGKKAEKAATADWMTATTQEQLTRVRKLRSQFP